MRVEVVIEEVIHEEAIHEEAIGDHAEEEDAEGEAEALLISNSTSSTSSSRETTTAVRLNCKEELKVRITVITSDTTMGTTSTSTSDNRSPLLTAKAILNKLLSTQEHHQQQQQRTIQGPMSKYRMRHRERTVNIGTGAIITDTESSTLSSSRHQLSNKNSSSK